MDKPEMFREGEAVGMALCHSSRDFLDHYQADVKQRAQYWAGVLCTVAGFMAGDTDPETARLVLDFVEKSLPGIHRGTLELVPPP
ncbi:MAG: hypothetical protein HPY82_05975 [Gammaproteobacteria bacterium]|nr:hypothetical protein [Gammaproteobacteria bacterium]